MTAGETVQRDLATPERLPPSHSDPSGWVPQTKRTVFWIRAMLITEAQRWKGKQEGRILKGENAEIGGKERARKGWVPALPPVSISDPSILPFILPLHPVPSPTFQQLASFLPQQRKTSLMEQTEASVCVQSKNRVSLSLNSLWIHTRCRLSPFLTSSSVSYHPFLSCFPKCPLHPPVFFLSQFVCLLFLPYLLSIFFTRPPLHPTLFILSPSLLLSRSSCHSCHSALSLDHLSSPLLIDLACRWDDRSSPPGEVDMYRYGAPTHCHRINIGWLQGIRCKGLFKEGFLPDIYLTS